MDWFPAIMTVVGVLIGVGIQGLRIWREKRDKYRDMVFERRLDAHQAAYYRCMRLLRVSVPWQLAEDGGLDSVVKEIDEATEWLNQNALYLDEGSREGMEDLMISLNISAGKYEKEGRKGGRNDKKVRDKVVREVGEVLHSLKKGIGVKHLPDQEI
jgi:hypothetical protein